MRIITVYNSEEMDRGTTYFFTLGGVRLCGYVTCAFNVEVSVDSMINPERLRMEAGRLLALADAAEKIEAGTVVLEEA